MALTANLQRDPKKRPEPYAVKDFMNYIETAPEKPIVETAAQRSEKLKALFGRINGRK